MRHRLKLDGRVYQVDLLDKHPLRIQIEENEETCQVELEGPAPAGSGRLQLGDRFVPYFVTETPTHIWVTLDGVTHAFEKARDRGQADDEHAGFSAPMPGKVIQVAVSEGDVVEKGAVLVVMEAMKMEHRIEAPGPGTVTALHCTTDAVVDQGFVLLDFEPAED